MNIFLFIEVKAKENVKQREIYDDHNLIKLLYHLWFFKFCTGALAVHRYTKVSVLTHVM